MIKRRNCYNDLAIENILDANVKLIDRNKDLEKYNKELEEKINSIKNFVNHYLEEVTDDMLINTRILKDIKKIINGEEYEENKDIFSFI